MHNIILKYNGKGTVVSIENKRININNAPRWFKVLMLLSVFIGAVLIKTEIDADMYFLLPTGKYILENGFPVKDFLSMHSSMDIIVQQWLSDIIFYGIYKILGEAGLIALVFICFAAYSVLIFKLCRLISSNFFISVIAVFISNFYVANLFMQTRPQIFTYIIIICELLALEYYIKTKKAAYLAVLPVLSVLLVNLHCSMWLMLLVFMLPYIAQAIPIKIGKIKQEPCCKLWALLITAAAVVLCGLINPYGIKAELYLFSSYGNEDINSLIGEMQPTNLTELYGVIFFAFVGLIVILCIAYKKGSFQTHHALLILGTLVLALSSYKGMVYFFICAVPAITYYFKDVEFMITLSNKPESKKEKRTRGALIGVFCVLLCALAGTFVYIQNGTEKQNESLTIPEKSVGFLEVLNEEDKENMVLYAGFNTGAYLEFNGYKPYIDARAELFLEDNNHEFDYFSEYCSLINGNVYYKDVLDKYGFTHLVVEGKRKHLLNSLQHDSDYELIYSDEYYSLYKKV